MFESRVPATPSQLEPLRRRADSAAADFGLDRSDRFAFVFAVNEAVTNAIRHGRPDGEGMIGVRVEANGETLTCSVSDSGQFREAPADTDPLAERGRGLSFIALMMDGIELLTAPSGTTVRLHKRRRNGARRSKTG